MNNNGVDLIRLGAIAAVAIVVLILLSGAAYVKWPYLPSSMPAARVLETIHGNAVVGFLGLDGLLVVSNLVGVLLFLALYAVLREDHQSFSLVALVLGIMAVILIFPARPIGELIMLSDRYIEAMSDADRMRKNSPEPARKLALVN